MTDAAPDFRRGMRLYLDSADENDWRKWLPTGLFHGLTCNPVFVEKAGIRLSENTLGDMVARAFAHGIREFHVQTWGADADTMERHGRMIAGMDPRVTVKVLIHREGAEAASRLARSGIAVTMTGLFRAHQAVSAAALGARYAAPYLGRINDEGVDGLAEVAAMERLVAATGSDLRILVAAIRSVREISVLAEAGLNTFTLFPDFCENLFAVDGTAAATGRFEAAAARMGG